MKDWVFRVSNQFFDSMREQLTGDYEIDAEDAYAAYDGL